jgi:hypothetical protein
MQHRAIDAYQFLEGLAYECEGASSTIWESFNPKGVRTPEMICKMLSKLLPRHSKVRFGKGSLRKAQMFENIFGYEGIRRTFFRSLNSKEPVHILLVGPPGQARTLFFKMHTGNIRTEKGILYHRRQRQ